ncbi:MAG: gliding motility protein [Myxococcales bacterium]|nr:gliding motility protein [Myxococcales bacterium]
MVTPEAREVVPELPAFARELTPGGTTNRAVRQLHARLCQVEPTSPLPERLHAIEQLTRWVCDGPKPPPLDGAATEPYATTRLRLLLRALVNVPELQRRLRETTTSVLSEANALGLLCEVGLPNDRGLLDETSDRLARRLLPRAPDPRDLGELFAHMFKTSRDADWLAGLPTELVVEFLTVLGDVWQPLRDATEDALALLTTRVSALGLSDDIRRRGPAGPVRESPFFRVHHAAFDELPELSTLCRSDLVVVLDNLERFGVSVDVVYRLEVIAKCLTRIESILVARDPRKTPEIVSAEAAFVAELVRARLREQSVRGVVRDNLQLLARKVIERAGETGEHYITVSRGEWWKMLASAAGGGFLTAFTCAGKFLTKWGGFAPAIEGMVNAVNFAGSFIGMQLLGFTLATKQPSMTAAALAGSIRSQEGAHQLDDLITTIARICRSQLAAALGNVGVVIPSAMAFDLVFRAVAARPFLDGETAHHAIEALHPGHSATIPFAALTGVLLWLSSLGAGWLENWAVYRRIPEAITEHRLGRLFGRRLFGFFGRAFKKHIAGFGGSVTLGLLLGMLPAFGKFFGLPVDVRHVTLSTGSLALSVTALGVDALKDPAVAWAALGILCIGSMNFGISFVLALGVAFRAREVPLLRGLNLLGAVLGRFVRSPLEFVYPPASQTEQVFSHRPSMVPRGSAASLHRISRPPS